MDEIDSLEKSYQKNKADLNEKTQALMESRQIYSEQVTVNKMSLKLKLSRDKCLK